MSELVVYGLCEANCKHRVLTVDQVTDLIQQMAANDWQVPEDYIPQTSVNGIVEQNSKDEIKLWVGTQAEYNALSTDVKNSTFAIITDDPTLRIIEDKLSQYGQSIESLNKTISAIVSDINGFNEGTRKVYNAIYADYASEDRSKGTIEDRLTNLGFKQGNITINDNVGSVVQITRQGNYVKCLFAWGDGITDFASLIDATYKAEYSKKITLNKSGSTFNPINFGTIDNNFIPKTTFSIPTLIKANNNGYHFWFPVELKVYGEDSTSKGKIEIINSLNEDVSLASELVGVVFNLGYEVSPLGN